MSTESKLFNSLVKAQLPAYEYYVPYRYRVVSVHPENNFRVDLQIVKKKNGLPDLLPMIMNPGVAGAVSELTEGCIVLVQFIEGNPSLPRILAFSDYEDPGFLPQETFIDAENLIKIGEEAAGIEFGDTDQLEIARAQPILDWANGVIPSPPFDGITKAIQAIYAIISSSDPMQIGQPVVKANTNILPQVSALSSTTKSAKVTSQ